MMFEKSLSSRVIYLTVCPTPAPLDEIDLDAITDMAEKAKIIAEATDRKEFRCAGRFVR